ncbi:MAG: hypothetical protein R3277_05885 [Brumimicrobium sp.]|nr:hypothetical protein [Brumimicrobium sp.]
MKSSRSLIVLIAVACTAVAVIIHEANIENLNSAGVQDPVLISTADEAGYLRPAQNFLSGEGWHDSSEGFSSYVQRPPGYGILYLISKLIYSSNPLLILKGFQITCFFLSILLFYSLMIRLDVKKPFSISFTLLYGLLPCYNGFMYYTLTESISPFMLILLTHEFVSILKNQRNPSVFIAAAAFLLVLRPQLTVFPILYILVIYLHEKRIKWIYIIGFLPFVLWQIRTITITGEINLHPIYSETNKSIFRPTHRSLTNLFRVWEFKSDRFHETVGLLVSDTTTLAIRKAAKNIPMEFRTEVLPLLKEYQRIAYERRKSFEEPVLPKNEDYEVAFIHKTDLLTQKLKQEHFIRAYLITPAYSAYQFLNKSYLNLWVYQKKWRGTLIIEVLRWICFLIINISFLATFLVLSLGKFARHLRIIALGVALTFFYMIFFQRLNEERYLVPLLPLMLLMIPVFVSSCMKK